MEGSRYEAAVSLVSTVADGRHGLSQRRSRRGLSGMTPRSLSTCGVPTNSPALLGISERQRIYRSSNYRRIFPIWFVKAGLSSWSAKQTADHPWRRTSCRRPVCLMYRVAGWNGGECSACQRTEKRAKGRNSYSSITRSTLQSPGLTQQPSLSIEKMSPTAGHVLTEAIRSPGPIPGNNRAAMDRFSVRASVFLGASSTIQFGCR